MDQAAIEGLARVIAIGMMIIGVILAVYYLATGRTRGSLLYFGVALTVAGAALVLHGLLVNIFIGVALLLTLIAIREGVREARARWEAALAESHDRETAFAEQLATTARQAQAEESTKQADDE